MKKHRKWLISIAVLLVLFVWVHFPPCRIIESAFLPTDIASLPDSGWSASDDADLEQMLAKYGISHGPDWLTKRRLKSDEMVVVYPNCRIVGTGPKLCDHLFIVEVSEIKERGVGVALLKGDVSIGVKFNDAAP